VGMLNDYRVSVKCRNLAVVAIACVVAIHSNSLITEENSPRWMYLLCDVLFGKLTCWAVPFFFAASGCWFGLRECSKGKAFVLSHFYLKKFRSLVVPYALFVLLGFVSSIPLAYMQGVKHGDGLLSHITLTWDVFGVTELLPHGNGPMWYLRSLIILFILAPVWRVLALRAKWLLLPMACLALVTPPLIINGVIPFRLGQSSFFFLGLFLSQFKTIYKKHMRTSVVFGIAAIVMITYTVYDGGVGLMVSGVLPYIMLVFVWTSYDVIVATRVASPSWVSRYVFWIFGVHIIFLNWMLPPVRAVIHSPYVLAGMTLVFGTFAFVAALISAVVVERTNRRLYAILSGGR